MVPALKFEAVGGLFLAFLSIHPLLAYYEAIGENFVGSLRCSECDDHMATGLTCCSALLRLDPSGLVYGTAWEPIDLFYIAQLILPLWSKVERDGGLLL